MEALDEKIGALQIAEKMRHEKSLALIREEVLGMFGSMGPKLEKIIHDHARYQKQTEEKFLVV